MAGKHSVFMRSGQYIGCVHIVLIDPCHHKPNYYMGRTLKKMKKTLLATSCLTGAFLAADWKYEVVKIY
jgi:hypothetical protein